MIYKENILNKTVEFPIDFKGFLYFKKCFFISEETVEPEKDTEEGESSKEKEKGETSSKEPESIGSNEAGTSKIKDTKVVILY